MSGPGAEACADCGLVLAAVDTAPHPYFGASASCWALFGAVLAREYADPALMTVHRLTVDAYALQHPGSPGRRQARSVRLHGIGLCLTVERRLAPDVARRAIGVLARDAHEPGWLLPPAEKGEVTVADVAAAADADADAHQDAVRRWAASVWAAWHAHHPAFRAAADAALAGL